MRSDLPSGTVTFLFTDVEGSTRLLHELGAEAYAQALVEHRRLIREACAAEGGVEVDAQGDAFFFAFPTAPGALRAGAALTEALASGPIHVRVGLHTGTPLLTEEGYVGEDVHRAARIAAAGHGGQVLVAMTTASLVSAELTDLGDHRFKDLAVPERVYQLGEGDFPPLKSLYQSNLPVPPNPLVGRKKELLDVLRLLLGDEARVVTVTGPGGVGKTRFAVAVAGEASETFPDGVWFVPLAPLRDPELVLATLASVVGAEGDLGRHLQPRECLVVLDNFEHVIDAATGLGELVTACPRLRVLVTSREVLQIAPELEYPLRPLPEAPSVELFRQRAGVVAHDVEIDFETAAAICERLDRLPLAIELAAARCKALAPTQILERLSTRLDLLKGGRDADARQRTLRATIEWSFDLLAPEEQRQFSHLAVFAGGCTLAAAEDVCHADLDTVQSLVEKSLVRFSNGRYWMLETIREYAREHLDLSQGLAALRERHAHYFLERAEAIGGMHVFEGDQPATLERIAAELDNFRAAIEWSLDTAAYEPVHRFGRALWFFWSVRGHAAEGRRLLEPAVTSTAPTTESWVWGAVALGELDRAGGDLERARALKEQALPILRERGEIGVQAALLADLGDLAIDRGEYALARELLEESLALRAHPKAAPGLMRTLGSLAELSVQEGDLEQAQRLAEQAVERSFETDPSGAHAGWSLGSLGRIRGLRGDLHGSEEAYAGSLRIMHALRNALGVADCLERLARVSLARGHRERAGRLTGAAAALRLEAGIPDGPDESLLADVPESARVEGAALGFDEAVEYALASID